MLITGSVVASPHELSGFHAGFYEITKATKISLGNNCNRDESVRVKKRERGEQARSSIKAKEEEEKWFRGLEKS